MFLTWCSPSQAVYHYLKHVQRHTAKTQRSVLAEARVKLDALHAELETHYQ